MERPRLFLVVPEGTDFTQNALLIASVDDWRWSCVWCRIPASGKLRLMRSDPIELEIFKNLYHSIAEEMGAALRRTAFSANIKERRDYSCAIFDGAGEVIAMGDHMPVHLGSMPRSVKAAIDAGEMAPGDVVMLNDPFRGGTHLPDITLVAPVYVETRDVAVGKAGSKKRLHSTGFRGQECPRHTKPDFYVASRAHHADVGGGSRRLQVLETFAGLRPVHVPECSPRGNQPQMSAHCSRNRVR